ncbi:MAG TPA: hypothetical protein DCQ26_06295 [Marinilabiliales bacterium]|nr:MAG: hypothetical protein A2W95_04055 [Bacteroidetes bacterium GWA2_40_14]OFX58503.1 MAG: hypothetical protein A2W84_08710 [Bacteroidetes bacterium GWC2_40_13]OFX74125.1 MAG: hypothetical protein A2W96_12520 [Bacteroidetes bacterium GWD2_40_43]OFX93041.1 MAG: hypothetical protein A2W97_05555 [Bacteroidetes bacterium GWE2_40_63]OFY21411.1 MAG: hypothetical protein A2W88_09555 [Bacteroidetes bacterium GWF2_40_13]OFZ27405.1 MAG: hypothetical protein A2437_14030 [Bacteroidetes bacterium RIFOXYC
MENLKSKKFDSLSSEEMDEINGGLWLWNTYEGTGATRINDYGNSEELYQQYDWFGLHGTTWTGWLVID